MPTHHSKLLRFRGSYDLPEASTLAVRSRPIRYGRPDGDFKSRSVGLKPATIVVGLLAVLGVFAASVPAGVGAQPKAAVDAPPHLAPVVPPHLQILSSSNNSSSNKSVVLSSCFTLGGTYYCFPEQAYWSNCLDPPLGYGPGCYNTWHFSVDVVVPTAPSSLGSSSSVYLWNGLENKQCWGLASGTCTLLQPVLEYSSSGISAFAAICVGSNGGGNCNTQFNTDTGFSPSVGDTLELDIWDTSSGASCWNAEVFDTTTGHNSGGLNDQCQHNWGWQMPIATFAMEDHNINPECPSGNYPYEPSSHLPIRAQTVGNWLFFNQASINSNIVWASSADDGNCGWETTYEDPTNWEAFNMPT